MPTVAYDRRRNGYLTVREAAERLNMHFMSVYKLVQSGELPAAKIGSRWKIDPFQLDGWIARHGGQIRRWLLVGPDAALGRELAGRLGAGHLVETVPYGGLAEALAAPLDVVLVDAGDDPHAALAALAVVRSAEPRPFAVLLVGEPTRALIAGALECGLVSLLSTQALLRAADELGAALHWT